MTLHDIYFDIFTFKMAFLYISFQITFHFFYISDNFSLWLHSGCFSLYLHFMSRHYTSIYISDDFIFIFQMDFQYFYISDDFSLYLQFRQFVIIFTLTYTVQMTCKYKNVNMDVHFRCFFMIFTLIYLQFICLVIFTLTF